MSIPDSLDHTQPALTVIVPARNCPDMLRASLEALVASRIARDAWELIVVDDCSTDGGRTEAVAAQFANRVLRTTQGPLGPGAARNLGARHARGPILLFIDSDVVVAPTTLPGFIEAFQQHPDVSSIFGAYDDAPAVPTLVSRYRNLLHHYVHVTNPGDASTFWAGCGAVRRREFLAVGGYDGVRYPRPQIEDIDLGIRLRAAGHRILLLPHLQGKHLKHWTFRSMVRTDFRERAVPWTYLLLEARTMLSDGPLNLARAEKARAIAAVLGVALLPLGVFTGWAALLAAMLLCFVLWGNRALLTWFARHCGLAFAVAVAGLRIVYYLTSVSGAAWATLTWRSVPHRHPLLPLRAEHDAVTMGASSGPLLS